ncbi:endonuclease/exonuclease/phosphatase family protein [Schleiferiaceae bacterium]|nr:endonuclease/exonuclease/phosphatase family protein [Schleiferiaceae bacterium]MDC3353717.1 endonuclease/exonuclease/phosphatase family protein [Schleiferiaceae bacterium]
MGRTKSWRRWLSIWPHLLAGPFTLASTLGYYIAPNPFPWLAPLALAWPLFFLWHLGWTLLAASQLRLSALLGLCILLLTWPQSQGWIHFNTESDQEGTFRLATWNVHQWRNANWTEPEVTEARMQQAALNLHADVLAIQENRLNSGPQRSLEAYYPHHTAHVDQGLQIFSKYPIVAWNFEEFKAGYPGHRGFVWADIEGPHGRVRVVNVHLVTTTFVAREAEAESDSAGISTSLFRSAWRLTRTAKIRAQQVDQLLAWAEQSDRPDLVWLGDFNDAPSSNTAFRMRHWTDAFTSRGRGFGSTYAGLWGFPLRIDWILLEEDLHCVGMKRSIQGDSDHHPLWVDLIAEPLRFDAELD